MSLTVQRSRIARVRRIQHQLAASAAANAAGQVRALENNQQRLRNMRHGLGAEPGPTDGSALASRGELAMRIEAARDGLGKSIVNAHAALKLREQARLGARRNQEAAEKLEHKARTAHGHREEKRSAGFFRRARRTSGNGEAE